MRWKLAPVFSFITLETAQAIAHIILNPEREPNPLPLCPSNVHLPALENTISRSVQLHLIHTDTRSTQTHHRVHRFSS